MDQLSLSFQTSQERGTCNVSRPNDPKVDVPSQK